MTPNLDSRAYDLSGLANKQPAAGASYVVNADERTFENAFQASMRHPVVFEFHSPRAKTEQLSRDLATHVNALQGKVLLVRVDVDAAPTIAQALGVQAVPMVVGALGGQLVPLFQGTRDSAEIKALLDELVKAAVANGIVGQAKPVEGEPSDATEGEQPQADPKYAAADAAMEAGDYATAITEFEKILQDAPGDTDAAAGKAGAELYQRVSALDPTAAVAEANAQPESVEAQLSAADLELVAGQPEAAFARLIEVVRVTSGDERDEVRRRLLDLFSILGPTDPAVLTARRDLMSALF